MNFRRRKRENAEVNAGSLSDILFFLLLFFIIISTLASASAIKVQLPNSKTGKSIPRHPINVTVNKDLQYYIDKRQIDEAALPQELATEAAKYESPSVVLRMDKTVTVQHMIDVMDIAYKLKLPIVVAANKEAEKGGGE